jgi:hypothetical protein
MLRKINLLLLSILIVTITGCQEDFLETKPTDAISAADALSSSDNLFLVISGLHRLMYAQTGIIPGSTNDRAGEHWFIPMDDALTGNLIHSARANNLGWQDEPQWLAHTNSQGLTVDELWYQRYHFIASSSAIINQVASSGLTITDDVSNILGQAYAYRAWCYYRLITHYAKGYLIGSPSTDAGVPLLTGSVAPYQSGPRATVAEIYAQMETDINDAITYLESSSKTFTGDNAKSNISANAAYGIKARIALSKGDWATAATAAAKSREGYPLMNETAYKSGFNTLALSEVIWGGNVISTETTFFRSYFYLVSNTFNGSQNRGNPKIVNSEKYNQLPATDYRRDIFLPLAPNTNGAASNNQGGSYLTDPNYNDAASFIAARNAIRAQYGMVSGQNLHPYMHVKFLNKNPGSIDPDDVIYMRSSEMYLTEAEAKAMILDIAGAQAALKPLGEARDSAYDVTVFDSQTKLMDEIKLQRYIELYGEGFGYTDHIRWDQAIDLTNSGASAVLYQNGFMQAKPSVNDAWVFKIPQAEIDANPFITEADQN